MQVVAVQSISLLLIGNSTSSNEIKRIGNVSSHPSEVILPKSMSDCPSIL
jgi:hypothetical protein